MRTCEKGTQSEDRKVNHLQHELARFQKLLKERERQIAAEKTMTANLERTVSILEKRLQSSEAKNETLIKKLDSQQLVIDFLLQVQTSQEVRAQRQTSPEADFRGQTPTLFRKPAVKKNPITHFRLQPEGPATVPPAVPSWKTFRRSM